MEIEQLPMTVLRPTSSLEINGPQTKTLTLLSSAWLPPTYFLGCCGFLQK